MPNLARSAGIITLFNVIGLFLGLFSSVFTARAFGATAAMDHYFVAMAVPTFISVILNGSINFTFIPIYAEYRHKNPAALDVIVSSTINIGLVASLGLCAAGLLFSTQIVNLQAPGFGADSLASTSLLFRLMLPTITFAVLNELLVGLLYAHHRFGLVAATRLLNPLLTGLFVVVLARFISTGSIVVAVVCAGGLQMFLLSFFGIRKLTDFHYRPVIDWRHPGVLKTLRLAGPLMAGMCIYKIVPVFDRWIASTLPTGSISSLGYATKLVAVMQPILVAGIATTFFPLMSRMAAEGDKAGVARAMATGIKNMLFVIIPAAALLSIFGKPIVQILFERGAFTAENTQATYRLFSLYVLVLPATAVGSIIGQGFYIFQKTRLVAVIGIIEIAAYIALGISLTPLLNASALPASYAVYMYTSILACGFLVSRMTGHSLLALTGVTVLGQLSATAISILCVRLLQMTGPTSPILALLFPAMGFSVYFMLQRWLFNSREAAWLTAQVNSKLRKVRLVPGRQR